MFPLPTSTHRPRLTDISFVMSLVMMIIPRNITIIIIVAALVQYCMHVHIMSSRSHLRDFSAGDGRKLPVRQTGHWFWSCDNFQHNRNLESWITTWSSSEWIMIWSRSVKPVRIHVNMNICMMKHWNSMLYCCVLLQCSPCFVQLSRWPISSRCSGRIFTGKRSCRWHRLCN